MKSSLESLKYLFNPKSIAIVGCSRNVEKVGNRVLRNLILGGFKGDIYPVNPNANEIYNSKCYKDLSEIDIGIMPLPDDEWAKGKCGFKGLQYMAMEIPSVMSPVGVNTEIINDGVNGFLASTEEEWIEKLSLLIESPELRRKFGVKGRQTVVENFSVDSQKQRYLDYFNELIKK